MTSVACGSARTTRTAPGCRIAADGSQHTVLTFLKAPQAIIADGKGGYLLAEGGRDRVLHLTPPAEPVTASASRNSVLRTAVLHG